MDTDLDALLAPFSINDYELEELTSKLANTYRSLACESEEQFLATPVINFPTGKEHGDFLAADFGGSNLRVAFVSLHGQPTGASAGAGRDSRITNTYERSWSIQNHLKNDNTEDLFAWMGDCLAAVIEARYGRQSGSNFAPGEVAVGVTFSFPMRQEVLSNATVMSMGKGFAIGSRLLLGELIKQGYSRHEESLPSIRLVAIANDAVSTLVSQMYSTQFEENSEAVVGLIVGTGCNASAVWQIKKLDGKKYFSIENVKTAENILLNCEWSLSGVSHVLEQLQLVTTFDRVVDAGTGQPGFALFECMTGGAYLGRLIQEILRSYFGLTDALEDKRIPDVLNPGHHSLNTTFLTHHVAPFEDPVACIDRWKDLPEMGGYQDWEWTEERATAFLRIEKVVARRATQLIAAAVVALLIAGDHLRIDELPRDGDTVNGVERESNDLVVAYCGGLICKYPHFQSRLQGYIDQLVTKLAKNGGMRVVLKDAAGGGLIGAGVLAAVASSDILSSSS